MRPPVSWAGRRTRPTTNRQTCLLVVPPILRPGGRNFHPRKPIRAPDDDFATYSVGYATRADPSRTRGHRGVGRRGPSPAPGGDRPRDRREPLDPARRAVGHAGRGVGGEGGGTLARRAAATDGG